MKIVELFLFVCNGSRHRRRTNKRHCLWVAIRVRFRRKVRECFTKTKTLVTNFKVVKC